MVNDADDEFSANDSEEEVWRQRAENIFNVLGNTYVYESQSAQKTNDELLADLSNARERLQSEKAKFHDAVRSSGWNSYDARSIAQDSGLARDQVIAVKRLLLNRGFDFPKGRYDAERLGEAVNRIQQQIDAAERQRADAKAVAEKEKADAQSAAEKEKSDAEFINLIFLLATLLAFVLAVGAFLWLSMHPLWFALVMFVGFALALVYEKYRG